MIAKTHTRRVLFAEINLTPTLYLCAAAQPLYWQNRLYKSGAINGISGLSENTDMSANDITISLVSSPQFIANLNADDYYGRLVSVYSNDLNENNQVIESYAIWSGWINAVSATIGATVIVSIDCSSPLSNWDNKQPRYLSDETQQQLYAGDRGMQYVQICQRIKREL